MDPRHAQAGAVQSLRRQGGRTIPRLEGKTAVVTGGAGPNIGSTVSRLFAAEGARVVVLDHDGDSGERVVSSILDAGGSAEFMALDVTRISEIESVFSRITSAHESVDILVNSAGGAPGGERLMDVDEATFRANIDLNLASAVFCTKALLPSMLQHEYGSVIFVSSINALLGGFSQVAYSVAKAGLHSLARVLTADYAAKGVRFNVICAGSIVSADSKTWKRRERDAPGSIARVQAMSPMRSTGAPEDVALGVLFFAGDESKWVSGTVLPIDGGLSAAGALPGGRWWEPRGG